MDDAALIGVHGLHRKAAAGLADLGADALCQCSQVALALVAVASHIQTQLDVVAFQTVGHEACQIGQALHGLAAAADQGTQLLAIQTDDGRLALLHGAEGHVADTHQGDDFLQVVHSGLDFVVLFDVDGNFDLFGLLCRSSRLFDRSSSFLHRSSGLLRGGSILGRGGSRCFFSRCFHLFLCSGCRGLLHNGGGGDIGFFHADTHLGGSQLQTQKARLLGHFQNLIAHIQILSLHTQQGAGLCAGFINRLAGCFLSTDHNRYSSSFLFSSLSGTVRSSL